MNEVHISYLGNLGETGYALEARYASVCAMMYFFCACACWDVLVYHLVNWLSSKNIKYIN